MTNEEFVAWADLKDGGVIKVITVCMAAPTGDQVVQPVMLQITDDVLAATDTTAIPTRPGWWENALDMFYDDQANQVHAALKALPMATRHRLLAKLLLEHPMLLRLPGADCKPCPVAVVRRWARHKDGREEWVWYDKEDPACTRKGFDNEGEARAAANRAGYRAVVDREEEPPCRF